MKKVKNENVCVVVKLSCRTFDFCAPRYAGYENKHIKSLTPCVEIGGKYYNVRTAQLVPVSDDEHTLIWKSLPGTVYEYPDGKNFLLTRRFADRTLLFEEIPGTAIRNTMVRHRVI